MKVNKLLTILILFFSLGLLVSCGSDNKVDTTINEPKEEEEEKEPETTSNNYCVSSGTYAQGVRNFSEFVDKVADGQFSKPSVNAWDEPFNNDDDCRLKSSRSVQVFYGKQDVSSSNSGRIGFWEGFRSAFRVNWYSCWNGECSGSGFQELSYRELYSRTSIKRGGDQFTSIDGVFGNSLRSLRDSMVDKLNAADKVYKCFQVIGCVEESKLNNEMKRERTTRYMIKLDNRYYIIDLYLPLMVNPIGIYDVDEEVQYFPVHVRDLR